MKAKSAGAKPSRSPERTKQRLIEAARKLFARTGFHGTTVQEIAREAGANVSLISHYYGGKEGLYRACIEDFGEARLQVLERVLETPRSRDEFRFRLEMFINELLNFHMENFEVTTILLRDAMNEKEIWGEKLDETLFRFVDRLVEYFKDAKKRKFLNEKIDPLNAGGLIYLPFVTLLQLHVRLKKQLGISFDDPAVRKSIVKQTMDTLWTGFEP